MKTSAHAFSRRTCAACVLVFTTAVIARPAGSNAADVSGLVGYLEADVSSLIQGTISARTEDSITVNGQNILVPATTPCTKNGVPMMISELHIGDQVKVAVYHDTASDTLRAVSIEVTTTANGSKAY